jgi:hypothetical protein
MQAKVTWQSGRGLPGGMWIVVLAACVPIIAAHRAAEAQPYDPVELEINPGNREVELLWTAVAEVDDPLFGGYNVWRSETPLPESFALHRRFQRRYPIAWTYCPGSYPDCGPLSADTLRRFVDPDSIVSYLKIEITSQGDSALTRQYTGIAPHNGFPYYYATTWYSECLSARNDTLTIHRPQPEIFEFEREGETLHGFLDADGDTLLVDMIDCRRIDRATNGPTGDPITVYRGTAESEEALRLYAIDVSRSQSPTFPSTVAQGNLTRVRAIPNPYVISAPWDEPARRKVQFINLTGRATVRIFTTGGDLVRRLEHPVNGGSELGSVDWDLKNDDGRLVQPGIYIFHVESPDHVVDTQGRLIIVF